MTAYSTAVGPSSLSMNLRTRSIRAFITIPLFVRIRAKRGGCKLEKPRLCALGMRPERGAQAKAVNCRMRSERTGNRTSSVESRKEKRVGDSADAESFRGIIFLSAARLP